jgi:DNA-binding NtrC family response regulator
MSRREYSISTDNGPEAGVIIWDSSEMDDVIKQAERVALFKDVHILISGECGVGKETIAKFIHSLTPGRKTQRFISLTSSRIVDISESIAPGTLFIRVIDALVKERETGLFDVVKKTPPEVRVISSTDKNLGQMSEAGQFSAELYCFVAQEQIKIPSLEKRKKDIIPLAEHFLDEYSREFKNEYWAGTKTLGKEETDYLLDHPWRNNVTELKNEICRSYRRACWNKTKHLEPPAESPNLSSAGKPDEEPHITPFAELTTDEQKEARMRAAKKDIEERGIKEYIALRKHGIGSRYTYNTWLKKLEDKDSQRDQPMDGGQNRPPVEPNRPTV